MQTGKMFWQHTQEVAYFTFCVLTHNFLLISCPVLPVAYSQSFDLLHNVIYKVDL